MSETPPLSPTPVHITAAAALFGVIALAGIYAAYAAVKDFAFARASGGWPTVEGVILTPKKPDGPSRYAYYFDGVRHEGTRLAFRTRGYIGSPPPENAGARAMVYVKPDAPATSVLVPGGSGRRFAVWLLLSGVAVFFGVAGVVRSMIEIDFPDVGTSDRENGDVSSVE
ncbi:MAG: DUF3592 domain-containing protein [Pseudomonadota bacterium]